MLSGPGALNRVGAAVASSLSPASAALNLDFTLGTLDDRITFTRASQATLFDSTGTLKYAKHNLLTYSEQFDDAAWDKLRVSVSANTVVAPNGTLSGDKLVEDGTLNTRRIAGSFTPADSTTYVFSLYVKAAERSRLILNFVAKSGGFRSRAFDLSTGTSSQPTTAGYTTVPPIFGIAAVGNGWYRCWVGGDSLTGATVTNNFRILMTIDGEPTAYQGDGTSGIFIWGAQLNLADMEGGVTGSLDTYYPTTTAAYYAPRFDYDPSTLAPRGLLIEEQRVNSIRNNTMQGAVAGTPGTVPTNWVMTGTSDGLTREIIGTGVENGITYVDVKYSGTTTAVSAKIIAFEAANQIVASSGQTWAASAYVKIAAGSLVNISSVNILTQGRDSGNTTFTETFTTPFTPTATLARFAAASTLANASTAFVRTSISINFPSGVAIDITLRIGLPQLEQGAFATSVIPTTTTALTRNADVASMTGTNFSGWYRADEGTLFAQAQSFQTTGVFSTQVISDGTTPNEMRHSSSSLATSPTFVVNVGGVSQASLAVALAITLPYKIASRYAVDDFRSAVNGTLSAADTSGTIPTVDRLTIGARGNNTLFLNGWIARLAYYPTKLGDSQLQALTA